MKSVLALHLISTAYACAIMEPPFSVPNVVLVQDKSWERVNVADTFRKPRRTTVLVTISSLNRELEALYTTELLGPAIVDLNAYQTSLLVGIFTEVKRLVDSKKSITWLVHNKIFSDWTYLTGMLMESAYLRATPDETQNHLCSIAPFIHSYMHVVYLAKLNGLPLMFGLKNILLSLVQLAPRYIKSTPWFLRIPERHAISLFDMPLVPTQRDLSALRTQLRLKEDYPEQGIVGIWQFFMDREQVVSDRARNAALLLILADVDLRMQQGESLKVSQMCAPRFGWEFVLNESDMEIRTQLGQLFWKVCAKSVVPRHVRGEIVLHPRTMRTLQMRATGFIPEEVEIFWMHCQASVLDLIHIFEGLSLVQLNGPIRFCRRDGWPTITRDEFIEQTVFALFTRDMVPSRGLGRILAIFLREGGGELAEFIPSPQPSISVFDSLFLSSEVVQAGFYDVFHRTSIESTMRDSDDVARLLQPSVGRSTGMVRWE